MTHSWPPPLTAIHTPSTAEPSKFPFPTKVIPCKCSRHCGRSETLALAVSQISQLLPVEIFGDWIKITISLASEVLHNAFKHFTLQIMSVKNILHL